MIAFKYLVIGINTNFKIFINKSFMQYHKQRTKMPVTVHVSKDGFKAVYLFMAAGENNIPVSFFRFFGKVAGKDLEILVEYRLGRGLKVQFVFRWKAKIMPEFNYGKIIAFFI